jgi:hypothetical protein
MDPITFRFIEWLVAVVIGGMAVFLGYRMFLKIPEHRDSQVLGVAGAGRRQGSGVAASLARRASARSRTACAAARSLPFDARTYELLVPRPLPRNMGLCDRAPLRSAAFGGA